MKSDPETRPQEVFLVLPNVFISDGVNYFANLQIHDGFACSHWCEREQIKHKVLSLRELRFIHLMTSKYLSCSEQLIKMCVVDYASL